MTSSRSAVEGPEVVGSRIVHHHVSEAVRAPRGPAASWNQRQRPGRPLAGLVGAGRGAPWCPGDQGEGRTQGTHRNPSRISHHRLVRKTCATELPDWCSDIEFGQVSRINSGVHIRAKRLIIISISHAVTIVIDRIDCARFRSWKTRPDDSRHVEILLLVLGDGSHRSVTYDENDSEG